MPERNGSAEWRGDLKAGSGSLVVGDGVFAGAYSFASRFEEGAGTNPEELIAAAHAACFTMAFAFACEKAGVATSAIDTTAAVRLAKDGDGFKIDRIALTMEATVPGFDSA